MSIFRQNKNTIKNIAFSLQEKYLRTRHNFGSISIKYLREKWIKKFTYTKYQKITGGKRNI